MTKEITKAFILQQIQDKFKLRELEPEKFRFSEMVIPNYTINDHLIDRTLKRHTIAVSGTGGVEIFTVPANKRYRLLRYTVVFTSGVFSVAGCYVIRKGGLTLFAYLDLTAGQTVSYAVDLPKGAVLGPTDGFYINIDGYTSSGSMYIYVDIEEEEIR